MPIDIYCTSISPPCSTVLLTLKILALPHDLKYVDLKNRGQLQPKFLKLNPQHTVPTLVDSNGLVIWESRAVITYLVEHYGKKNHNFYPTDPAKRAVINQRLYFDFNLYQKFVDAYHPIILSPNTILGSMVIPEEKLSKIEEAFNILNTFLTDKKYAAGDNFTLADIGLVTTVTTFQSVDFDLKNFPNVTRWLKGTVYQIPGYEEIHGRVTCRLREMYLRKTNK